MKTFRELSETNKSDKLAQSIDKAIIKIDDNMSVSDFALATASILKEQYGSHNFDSFIKVLKDNLER